MTKTVDELAKEYAIKKSKEYVIEKYFKYLKREEDDNYELLVQDFIAGYKVGFEIGCMKGSMAMQSTLDDDYHLTPIIDHEKLAKVMIKKETE